MVRINSSFGYIPPIKFVEGFFKTRNRHFVRLVPLERRDFQVSTSDLVMTLFFLLNSCG